MYSAYLLSTLLLMSGCARTAAQAPPEGMVQPVGGSGEAASTEPLENTYWKLIRLGEAPVTVASGQPEAHFILHPDTRRVSGSGGCNRLTGSYELSGDQLSFGNMAGTMMACQDGMDTERAFLHALQQAHKARVTRHELELFDAAGNGLARFEARAVSRP